MGLSVPRAYSLVIIALQPAKKMLGIKPMGRSDPWTDSLDIIFLDPVNNNRWGLTQWSLVTLGTYIFVIIALQRVKKWLGINLMGFSAPWYNSIDIIVLQTAKINC